VAALATAADPRQFVVSALERRIAELPAEL
jgi:hypothetical protein